MMADVLFADRLEAAELLAKRLDAYRGANPLVLGIPRGAVPMARVIADALEGELDVVLVHKLGAPAQPEYAIGSVNEAGNVYLSDVVRQYEIPETYIDEEVRSQLETLRRRRSLYTPGRSAIAPTGRTVIVVDNGIATGWTMVAALRAARAGRPAKLVAAGAVAPPNAVGMMKKEADEVVFLEVPEEFYAVGQFFADFRQVTDEEVRTALACEGASRHRRTLS